MNKERIRSSLDSIFEELGELDEVKVLTQKKVLARQLDQGAKGRPPSPLGRGGGKEGPPAKAPPLFWAPKPTPPTPASLSRAATARGAAPGEKRRADSLAGGGVSPRGSAAL